MKIKFTLIDYLIIILVICAVIFAFIHITTDDSSDIKKTAFDASTMNKLPETYLNYYKDGYNLYLRMREYMPEHLLFLHDSRVPATNNEAERHLRKYKRKQQQAVSFRSPGNLDSLCQSMSMLVAMRQKEDVNIFNKVSQVFG